MKKLTHILNLFSTITDLYCFCYLQHSVRTLGEKKGALCGISNLAEWKILFVLSYYVIFGVSALIYFGLLTSTSVRFSQALQENFICEASGIENNCDHSEFEQFTYPMLAGTTYFLIGFIPVVNLGFVIQWTAAQKKIRKWMNRMPHQLSFCNDFRVHRKRVSVSNVQFYHITEYCKKNTCTIVILYHTISFIHIL